MNVTLTARTCNVHHQNGVRCCHQIPWCDNTLTISRLLEVDICVPERPTSDHVSAHSDREDGPGRAEFLVEHCFSNICMQVSHIEGGHRVAGSTRIHCSRCLFSANTTRNLPVWYCVNGIALKNTAKYQLQYGMVLSWSLQQLQKQSRKQTSTCKRYLQLATWAS